MRPGEKTWTGPGDLTCQHLCLTPGFSAPPTAAPQKPAGELAALLGHPESQRRWAAHARRIAAYPTARWRGKDVLRNSAGQGEESGPTLDDEVWALSEGVWGWGEEGDRFRLSL